MGGVNEVDALAQFIRQVDGNHTLGASDLAEKIIEWQASQPVTDEQVETAAVALHYATWPGVTVTDEVYWRETVRQARTALEAARKAGR